jgi:hypothetical protein
MAQTSYRSTDALGPDLYKVYDPIDANTANKFEFPYLAVVEGKDATLGCGKFIFLKGIGSTAEGSVVTYDEEGVTALLAANAKGPIAVAMAATVANKAGWYQIFGKAAAKAAAGSAADTFVGREGADGSVGDGRAAGDEIVGAMARSATDTPATGFLWLQLYGGAYVNDATGS